MWQKLRKLVVGDDRDEAVAASAHAGRELERAQRQEEEAEKLTGRIIEHGRRNHFGERIEAAARRAYP